MSAASVAAAVSMTPQEKEARSATASVPAIAQQQEHEKEQDPNQCRHDTGTRCMKKIGAAKGTKRRLYCDDHRDWRSSEARKLYRDSGNFKDAVAFSVVVASSTTGASDTNPVDGWGQLAVGFETKADEERKLSRALKEASSEMAAAMLQQKQFGDEKVRLIAQVAVITAKEQILTDKLSVLAAREKELFEKYQLMQNLALQWARYLYSKPPQ
jgi:hypothetical protein